MDIAFLLVGAALGFLIARSMSKPAPAITQPAEKPSTEGNGGSDPGKPEQPDSEGARAPATPVPPPDPRKRLQELIKALEDRCDRCDRGADLAPEPRFVDLTELLTQPPFTREERTQWVTSQTTVLSCAALAAMAKLDEAGWDDVARSVVRMGYMALHFAFEYLARARHPEVAGQVLLAAELWWSEHPGTRARFIAWMDAQSQARVQPALPTTGDGDWSLEERRNVLQSFRHPFSDAFVLTLERADRARRGQLEMSRVGHWLAAEEAMPVAQTATVKAEVEALLEVLGRDGRPSVVWSVRKVRARPRLPI